MVNLTVSLPGDLYARLKTYQDANPEFNVSGFVQKKLSEIPFPQDDKERVKWIARLRSFRTWMVALDIDRMTPWTLGACIQQFDVDFPEVKD